MHVSDDERRGRLGVRKSHRKSRLGCTYCKRRRIKCDEKKPACSNCVHRELVCSLSVELVSRTSTCGPALSSFVTERQAGFTKADALDFELFHHFCQSTAISWCANREPYKEFWSIFVPQLAFKHPFLLHAIITMAALHVGHIEFEHPRNMPAHLQAKAESHWQMALNLASPLLLNVDESNCAALYLFATITCTYIFALGPRQGDLLLVNTQGSSQWLKCFRGIRAIEEACDLSVVQDENSQAIFALSTVGICEESSHDLDPSIRDALGCMHSFALRGLTNDDEYRALNEASQLLRACFASVFQHPTMALAYVIFSWLHRVSDDYLQLAQDQHSSALVIFAHFIVLLNRMEGAWMVRGWAQHLIAGVYEYMPEDTRSAIAWPMEMTGWTPPE